MNALVVQVLMGIKTTIGLFESFFDLSNTIEEIVAAF